MVKKRITKFDDFPKDFLSGYGRATDTLSKMEIQRRLKYFTCEMIRRPPVGVSEFAGTVNANVPIINENLENVFQKADTFKSMLQSIGKITKNLDIITHVLLTSKKFDVKTLKSFCHLSASIYLVSIHILVNHTLCGDPNFLRASVKMNKKSDGKLRKWANTKGSSIKSWCKLVKLVEGRKANMGGRIQVSSSEEESSEQSEESEENEESEDGSDAPDRKRRGNKGRKRKERVKKKRKQQVRESEDEEREEEENRKKD